MNWLGRPLTSHDVIVNSIAATTTRSGLRVEAALDTDTYDTGVKVTDAQIDALPMHRHRFHGDWNYTLHPAPADALASPGTATAPAPAATDAAHPAGPDHADLRDPELTGMTASQLDGLISTMTPALARQREQLRHQRRGGERRRAPGAGAKAKLSDPERVLATVLHLRKIGTQELIGKLFAVDRSTITNSVAAVRPLLEQHGHTVPASTARFRTPSDVAAFLASAHQKIKSPC